MAGQYEYDPEDLDEEPLEDDAAAGADGDAPASGSSDTHDAPAPEAGAPAPEKSDVAAKPGDSAQPRDASGKFAAKGAQQPTDAVPADQQAAPQSGADATGAPGSPSGNAPATSAELPAWSFRADGQEIPIEGSRLGDVPGLGRGLFVPEAVLPAVQRTLAQGVAHQGSFRQTLAQKDRQIAEARELSTREKAEATAALQELDRILESEDTLLKFVSNFQQNKALLKERAARAADRAKLERYERGERSQRDEGERAELDEAKDHVLEQTMLEIAGLEECQGLSQEDLVELYQELHGVRDALFRPAAEDLYDEAGQLIARRGQLVLDTERVQRRMLREAKTLGQLRQQQETARKAAEAAAARNKATLAAAGSGQGNGAPPAVAGGSAGAPATGPRQFKNREEYNEYIRSGGTRDPRAAG